MPSAAEIRAWARENGIPVSDTGRPSGGLRRQFAAAHPPPPEDDDPFADGAGDEGEWSTAADEPPEGRAASPGRAAAEAAAAEAREASAPPPGAASSRPPGSSRPRPPAGPGWRDRLRSARPARPAAGGQRAGRPRAARPARPAHPRMPLDRLFGAAYTGLAKVAETFNPPVGRVLAFQAPVAGAVFEDKFRGTLVDRAMQPFARMQDQGETLTALIGPPALVLALQAQPGAAPVLLPLLRGSLVSWIRLAGPKAAQQAREDAEFEEEHGAEIDAALAMFFKGIPGFDPAAGPFMGTPERAQWEAQEGERREAERAANGGPPPGARVVQSMVLQPFTPPGA
jgi:hypothetical protein